MAVGSSQRNFILGLALLVLLLVFVVQNAQRNPILIGDLTFEGPSSPPANFATYRQCLIDGIFDSGKSAMWLKFPEITNKCQQQTVDMNKLGLVDLRNSDEVKHVRKPAIGLKPEDECNVVTLGIGRDTGSEQKLVELIPKSCKFSGADPIEEFNKDLYVKLGAYFKFAVGATNGIHTASIMGFNGSWAYQNVKMEHVDLITFLKKHVGVKEIVDYLLMDNEGAEYDMMEMFMPGGLLDQNGLTVCQWSCEFHSSSEANYRRLSDFMIKNLVAGRFLPFAVVQVGHMRMTLLNYRDATCVNRYLPDFK